MSAPSQKVPSRARKVGVVKNLRLTLGPVRLMAQRIVLHRVVYRTWLAVGWLNRRLQLQKEIVKTSCISFCKQYGRNNKPPHSPHKGRAASHSKLTHWMLVTDPVLKLNPSLQVYSAVLIPATIVTLVASPLAICGASGQDCCTTVNKRD